MPPRLETLFWWATRYISRWIKIVPNYYNRFRSNVHAIFYFCMPLAGTETQADM